MLENWGQHLVVLGAAGKMGSGISLLLLEQISLMDQVQLTLLDVNVQGFAALKDYLRAHLKKFAERNISAIREKYALRLDLIDNGEILEDFLMQTMDRVRFVSSLEECKGANLIFEAIVEDVETKAETFRSAALHADPKAYFFTNTSSIPISVLQEKSKLPKRLIGFHFYNPPAVQKLLEIIAPDALDDDLKKLADEIAAQLRKVTVYSKDVAGFIGNGYFIREINYACAMVRELEVAMSTSEAVGIVDYMTREFLLRPMGVFQLVDYVGVDVCQRIEGIMTTYLLSGPFTDPLIDAFVDANILGGQHPDGKQKDGIFKYIHDKPAEVYDVEKKLYVPIPLEKLGALPPDHLPWKVLSRDADKQEKLQSYFRTLWEETSPGAELAKKFLNHCSVIVHLLVDSGVAGSLEDVNKVLKEGFYHLYAVEEPLLTEKMEEKE